MSLLYAEYKASAIGQLNYRLERKWNILGYELLSHSRYKDAIRIFELALSHFPNSANFHDSFGETYLLDGDTTNAVINYKASLRLDPDNEHAIEILSTISSSN